MRNDPIARLLSEVKQPLIEVLDHLSSHASDIHSCWLKTLKRYPPCAKHAALLARLHLGSQVQKLSASPRAFKEESECQGQELARLGVSVECVAVAVALYVECCLPYLLTNDDPQKMQWVKAFARFASVYRHCLLSGYARHGVAERQLMEARISQSERRSQDFSLQLGDAYEKERRRLAQDLHDEIGHDLIVLKLYLEVIGLDSKSGDMSQVRRKLKESVTLVKHALKGVRHLTFNLGPSVWSEQGFVPAVRFYVRQFAKRTGIKVRFSAARLTVDLPAHYETALYKVLQGALSNVVAHAGAQHVGITLASRRDAVTIRIEDDGKGFNAERLFGAPSLSFGLRAMKDRIELLGGAISFESKPRRRAAAGGTTIEIRLPLCGVEKT